MNGGFYSRWLVVADLLMFGVNAASAVSSIGLSAAAE